MHRSLLRSVSSSIAVMAAAVVAGCTPSPEADLAGPARATTAAGATVQPAGATVQRLPALQRSETSLSPALRDLPAQPGFGPPVERRRPLPLPRPSAGPVAPWLAPLAPQAQAATPAPLVNFLGVGQGFTGPAGTFTVSSAPPDASGAVGPRHYVQMVNAGLAVFDKTGAVVAGPLLTNAIWAGFGGGCQANNDGDGMVLYDRLADRWIISQFSVTTTPMLECVAVSQTSDPSGAYHRYAFSYGANMPDYPKLSVWPDAYYATYNMFNGAGTAFLGAQVCAFDRAAMLAGLAAAQQCFMTSTTYGGLLPSDLDGRRPPPPGAPNTLVSLGATATTLAVWQFHVDWAAPANSTFTGPTTVTVPTTADPCPTAPCVPQLGSTTRLDALGDRLMTRLAYRNHGGFEALVLNHTVAVGGAAGVRWYELRNPSAPVLQQTGTFAPTAAWRWMASVAQDQVGDLALGYSHSDPTAGTGTYPSIRYAGRAWNDAAGVMGLGESVLQAGGGAQTGTLTRWGDYTSMTVDPVDDCTFWYTNQYLTASGSFNWSTRIGSFKLPTCPPRLTLTGPASAVAGTPVTVTLTAQDQLGNTLTPYAGSAAFTSSDPRSTLPAPAAFAAGGASASVTFRTAGTAVLTATDPIYPESLTGQLSIPVGPAAASSFALGGLPASTSAGNALGGTVSAMDAFGNQDTAYAGTATVTVSDAAATSPANVTFVAGRADLPVTLRTAGLQQVTVTGPGAAPLTATASIQVTPGPTAAYHLSGQPARTVAGAGLTFTATATDACGNVATAYSGTARATSDDPAAALPAQVIFSVGMAIVPVTLKTAGNRVVTLTDATSAALTGSSAAIGVDPGAAASLSLAAPSPATAGTPLSVALQALDAYANLATSYAGTVDLTSTDPRAVVPAGVAFAAGQATATVTPRTAGQTDLRAQDVAAASLSGATSIAVNPGALAACSVAGLPPATVAGNTLTATVTALDAWGNVEIGLGGSAQVSSDDPQAAIPAAVTFVAGQAAFQVTLRTAGAHGVTVDAGGAVTCAATTSVAAGPARRYGLTIPTSAMVGAALDFTASARDDFGNVAAAYAGTAHPTSSDAGATLPADLAFAAGQASGRVTFNTAGTQGLTIRDSADATITGTASVAVTAPRTSGGCGCGSSSQGDLVGLLALVALAWRRRGPAGAAPRG